MPRASNLACGRIHSFQRRIDRHRPQSRDHSAQKAIGLRPASTAECDLLVYSNFLPTAYSIAYTSSLPFQFGLRFRFIPEPRIPTAFDASILTFG